MVDVTGLLKEGVSNLILYSVELALFSKAIERRRNEFRKISVFECIVFENLLCKSEFCSMDVSQ